MVWFRCFSFGKSYPLTAPWLRGNFPSFFCVFFLWNRRLFPKIPPNGSSKKPSMMSSGSNLKAGRGRFWVRRFLFPFMRYVAYTCTYKYTHLHYTDIYIYIYIDKYLEYIYIHLNFFIYISYLYRYKSIYLCPYQQLSTYISIF